MKNVHFAWFEIGAALSQHEMYSSGYVTVVRFHVIRKSQKYEF